MSEAGKSNDQQDTDSDTQGGEAAAPAQAGHKGGNLRLKILLFVFGLTLFALGYDFFIARAGVETAFEKVEAMNAATNTTSFTELPRAMTNLDVQKALGRAPSKTYEDGMYTVEVYRWIAGLPIKTRDYYAVYLTRGSTLVFNTHFKFGIELAELQVPPVPVTDTDEEELGDDLELDPATAMGGPVGGGEAGGGEGGGGRRGNPVAMFEEWDADGDEKLTGDEIPDRMKERLDAIDTDKDGAVSLAELQARMSQIGGQGRGQRPPLEAAADESTSKNSEDGDTKDGDAEDGDAKDGEAKDGEAKDGEAKDGEAKASEPEPDQPEDE